jgi:hypothetical protein
MIRSCELCERCEDPAGESNNSLENTLEDVWGAVAYGFTTNRCPYVSMCGTQNAYCRGLRNGVMVDILDLAMSLSIREWHIHGRVGREITFANCPY